MNIRAHLSLVFLATAVVANLSGCSGGGGGDSPPPPPAAPSVTVSGVAASGAPFTDAVVSITDSRGVVVGTSSAVGSTGVYSINLAAGAQAPFVITASRSNASGGTDTLVSVLATASTSTVNVTPITTLIAARLSPSGNPLALAGEMQTSPSTVTSTRIATGIAEVRAILAPVLTATGTTGIDPVGGIFAADGTGLDRALDSIAVHITPASGSVSNIEVEIRTVVAEGAQPPVIRFTSDASLATIQTNNATVINSTINSADLVPAGTSALIQNFMTRWTACYALPLTSRIATNGSTAADITAPACRTLFVGDDPATYLSNGSIVGLGRSFNSLFLNGGTGVTFSQGSYEFTRTNGDLVIGYRSRSPAGAETTDVLVVRRVGDELKLIGNQYAYPGGVVAYMQHREFPTRSQSAYNYRSTGYVLNVANTTASGTPIFDRVEVTSPGRDTPNIVLRPAVGHENLRIVNNTGVTGTSFIRLNSAFDNSGTAGTPESIDSPGLVFSNPGYTDEQIANFAPQSVWRFDYYLAANPSVIAATQYYRTRARAMTLAEFRTRPLAALAGTQLATISANASSGGAVNVSGLAGYGMAWDVPAGALPPTGLSMFGVKYTSPSTTQAFNDSATVASTARSGTITCSTATAGDVHCGLSGGFGLDAYATGLHLWARDGNGRELVRFYATYTVPVPR